MGEQLSQMIGNVSQGVGSFAQGAANLGGQAINGVEGAIGAGVNGLESLFGGGGGTAGGVSGPTGQPATGSPGATAAVTSQSAAAPAAATSVAGLADALPNVGGGDLLNSILDQTTQVGGGTGSSLVLQPGGGVTAGPQGSTPAPVGQEFGAQALGLPATGSAQPSMLDTVLHPSNWTAKGVGEGATALAALNSVINPAGKGTISAERKMLSDQQALAKQKQPLVDAEEQGKVPAGAQSLINQQLSAKQAAIRQTYANMGLSGSTAELNDLNSAKEAATAMQFEEGQAMAKDGLSQISSATGASQSLLEAIMQAETAQNTQLGQTLSAFAAAAAR